MVLSVFHRTDGTNLSAEARLACLYMYLVTPASSKTDNPKRFCTDAVDVFRVLQAINTMSEGVELEEAHQLLQEADAGRCHSTALRAPSRARAA